MNNTVATVTAAVKGIGNTYAMERAFSDTGRGYVLLGVTCDSKAQALEASRKMRAAVRAAGLCYRNKEFYRFNSEYSKMIQYWRIEAIVTAAVSA